MASGRRRGFDPEGAGKRWTESRRGWGLLLRGIRVYELARELDLNSKDILRLLSEEMHIDMNNHMATLNDQVVAKLRRLVAERRGSSAPRPTTGKAPQAPAATGVNAGGPKAPAAAPTAVPAGGAQVRPASAVARPPASRPAAGAPRTGPVHFRPAPGLLPLVTPHPTPPRPRRPLRAEPARPVSPAPGLPAAADADKAPESSPASVTPAVEEAETPDAAAIATPVDGAPAAAPATAPPEAPHEPAAAAPTAAPSAAPSAPAPAARVEEEAKAPPAAAAAVETEPHPAKPEAPAAPVRRPAAARPAAYSIPTGEAQAPRPGLLPVRKIVPGAPPPLRDPERPLLPVRRVDPNAPRPAASAGVMPAAGAPSTAVGAPRRDRPRPGFGEGTEIRRRGGAGRRPSRPGGVLVGSSDDSGGRRGRGRRRRRLNLAGRAQAQVLPPAERIELSGPLQVAELAERLRVPVTEVIKKLLEQGVMAGINQQLEPEQARAVAEAMEVAVDSKDEPREPASPVDRDPMTALLEEDNPERRAERPPIVTVLGHVDHGKTSLLDAIRRSRVAQGEAGGITQHIGAYEVAHGDRTVVFLDTPGHEAFTAMRARGAQVTDIAVLVVAADDGVMPQTLEAISHARAARVPIVVALNKIDKPNANQDRVLQQLADAGLVAEAWGGDTIVVPVSALKGQGIPQLLEMLLLVADVQELKADPQRPAVGSVIEARVERGRGPVATVLVHTGTLRVGDTFVAGQVFGRARALLSDAGKNLREAGPSKPVVIMGFEELPQAGDTLQVMDERAARSLAGERKEDRRREALSVERAVTLAEFHQDGDAAEARDLKVIVKADVQGSLEALRASLDKLHQDEVRLVLLHAGVGPVSESDVMLASASDAVILGFNVRPDANAEREAQRTGVEIQTYRVIYELLDEVARAMTGRLQPKFETVVVGHAEVRRTIRVPDVGVIAGSYLTDGVVRRGAPCRLLRGGTIVHEGSVGSLRRFKDDVREVAAGYECGIGVERYPDVKEGDVIEVLEEREVPR